MTPECSFILPNGKKCRCAATRNQSLCRHHAPKPALVGPPLPKYRPYSHLARWRELGNNLRWMPADDIPHTIYELLQCLVDRGPEASTGKISDLTAGRFLRVLLTRLGDVPFADPDPPSGFLAPAYPSASAVPTTGPAPDARELNAMLAVLGVPPSHMPMNQSRVRVNQ